MQPCSSRQVSAVPFEVRIRPRSQRNRETCCRMPYLFMCMWDRVYDVFHHIIILILIINIYIYIYNIYICVCICICWHTWLKSIVSGCVNVCMFPCFHFFNVHLRNMWSWSDIFTHGHCIQSGRTQLLHFRGELPQWCPLDGHPRSPWAGLSSTGPHRREEKMTIGWKGHA